MNANEDQFGLLLSEILFHGSRKVDGNKVIEMLLELDRTGKLSEEERKFWIPPEFRRKTDQKLIGSISATDADKASNILKDFFAL